MSTLLADKLCCIQQCCCLHVSRLPSLLLYQDPCLPKIGAQEDVMCSMDDHICRFPELKGKGWALAGVWEAG
jgi:hypothetical protein